MGWFKNDAVYMSDEFNALGKHTQEFLKQPHVPIFEIATVSLIPKSDTRLLNLSLAHSTALRW